MKIHVKLPSPPAAPSTANNKPKGMFIDISFISFYIIFSPKPIYIFLVFSSIINKKSRSIEQKYIIFVLSFIFLFLLMYRKNPEPICIAKDQKKFGSGFFKMKRFVYTAVISSYSKPTPGKSSFFSVVTIRSGKLLFS